MPIKWSAVQVSNKVDELEELVQSIRPTLWRIREKAEELRRIPNLPGYIDQPAVMITDRVERFNDHMKGYVERIRNLIPKEALGEERKVSAYGRTGALM